MKQIPMFMKDGDLPPEVKNIEDKDELRWGPKVIYGSGSLDRFGEISNCDTATVEYKNNKCYVDGGEVKWSKFIELVERNFRKEFDPLLMKIIEKEQISEEV